MLSTFYVTTDVDPARRLVRGSLRWAVAQADRPANQGSTVEITPSVTGTITLHAGELKVRSSMTISDLASGPLTIRQGTRAARLIDVVNNGRTTALTITGTSDTSPLTLTGGFARNSNGGGILVENPRSILTLNNVDVVGNTAAQVVNPRLGSGGNGGGIYTRGTVTLNGSSVSGNSARGLNAASGHAGGVYADQGVTMVGSHVDANAALNGAGILNVFGSVEVLNGSTVNGNTSSGNSLGTGSLGGGGISEMDGNVVISASQVNGNKTVGMYSGGIVLLIGGATLTDGSQVDGNRNNGPGGGIAANFGGAVVVQGGSQVDDNTAAGIGGGIVNFSATQTITVTGASQVSNNLLTNGEYAAESTGFLVLYAHPAAFLSGGRGDPMLASSFQLFLNAIGQRASLFQQAAAALPSGGAVQVGGGIASMLSGPVVVDAGSTISGNRFAETDAALPALGVGGGVFSNLGAITVGGATISGNTATGDGGGIWSGVSLTMTQSTVTGNTATGHGGGIFNRGSFTSSGSTIAGNTPDNTYPA